MMTERGPGKRYNERNRFLETSTTLKIYIALEVKRDKNQEGEKGGGPREKHWQEFTRYFLIPYPYTRYIQVIRTLTTVHSSSRGKLFAAKRDGRWGGGLLPFRLLINNGSAKLSSEIRGAGKRIKEHGSVEKSTGLAKGYCSLPDRVSETEEWILHSRMDARNKREKMKKKTRKKRKKGRGGRGNGERSFQTNRGSIHPRYSAPRHVAAPAWNNAPVHLPNENTAGGEAWTEMRVALQRATRPTVPSLSLTELNGPAHVVARTSYVVNLHLVRLLDRSMISDDFARINTHRPWDLPRFVR